jgi:hypothetical protein
MSRIESTGSRHARAALGSPPRFLSTVPASAAAAMPLPATRWKVYSHIDREPVLIPVCMAKPIDLQIAQQLGMSIGYQQGIV